MHFRSLGFLALLGLASALRGAEPKDEIVELPPFLVTPLVNLGTSWRHGTLDGYEVLSQCSDRETREIAWALWRGRQLVLPPSMRPRFALPMTIVLFNQQGSAGGNLATLGLKRGAGEINRHWTNLSKRVLEDRESFALNLWPDSFTYSAAFRFDLFTLLRRRTPAAPAWLNEGLFGGYGVHREGVYWYESSSKKGVHVAAWCSREEIRTAVRVMMEEEDIYKKRRWPRMPSQLVNYLVDLPILFEGPPPAKHEPAYDRWAATLALFVRWGTYDCPQTQVDQFWRFAERACSEVVTEPMFKECFGGRSYAEVRAELSWYLPIALTQMGEATAYDLPAMPKLRLEDATPIQIARVRGEWERMESVALAPRYPDLAKSFREQAARTLNQPKATVDPRVQASLGLLALDAGDLVKAREHFEKAVAGKVPGSRPYSELARLKWTAARLDNTGTLPPAVLAEVTDLILAAERQPPPARVDLPAAGGSSETGRAPHRGTTRGVGTWPEILSSAPGGADRDRTPAGGQVVVNRSRLPATAAMRSTTATRSSGVVSFRQGLSRSSRPSPRRTRRPQPSGTSCRRTTPSSATT